MNRASKAFKILFRIYWILIRAKAKIHGYKVALKTYLAYKTYKNIWKSTGAFLEGWHFSSPHLNKTSIDYNHMGMYELIGIISTIYLCRMKKKTDLVRNCCIVDNYTASSAAIFLL
jgi:hypothetical protein